MSNKAKPKTKQGTRDADRSREAILKAAEELFAERGFDGISLSDIATGAGLSRGTPSYFFGSKEQLYQAVLERVFRAREEVTRRACQPLLTWAASNPEAPIREPLNRAIDGYLDFLLGRPSFFKLIQREELSGAIHLQGVARESKAIEEAFAAVRKVAKERNLKEFEVKNAVLLFISLTFFPLAQRSTFMTSLGRDLNDAADRRKHVRLSVDQLLHLIGSREAD